MSDTETINGNRFWRCDFKEGSAQIACGGTHVSSTVELEKIEVQLDMENEETFTMITTSQLKTK